MALDHTLERTRGLDLQHAKSRKVHMVEKSKTYVLGVKPAREFLEDFLPLDRDIDRKPLLSPWKAFDTVPHSAVTVAEIQAPLVCFSPASHDFFLSHCPRLKH